MRIVRTDTSDTNTRPEWRLVTSYMGCNNTLTPVTPSHNNISCLPRIKTSQILIIWCFLSPGPSRDADMEVHLGWDHLRLRPCSWLWHMADWFLSPRVRVMTKLDNITSILLRETYQRNIMILATIHSTSHQYNFRKVTKSAVRKVICYSWLLWFCLRREARSLFVT